MQLKRGLLLGRWKLVERLGSGGNGQVWSGRSDGGDEAAIKILTKVKKIAYQRFRDEVKVLHANRDIAGLLPLFEVSLPAELDAEHPPWFAMPAAERFVAHADELALGMIRRASLFVPLASTLAALHERGVAHRDIKPSNLLWFDGRPYVCDFGLVDFPGKEDLTGTKEELGPRWTMAPEVRRLGSKADPIAADVYSLAKTLWMVVTREETGFEGQYAATGSLGLSRRAESSEDVEDRHAYWGGLDSLLTKATEHDPALRPTMKTFRAWLQSWLAVAGSWAKSSAYNWSALQRRVFPVGVPRVSIWKDLDDIVGVLNELGASASMNHMFFPDGGGMDLASVVRSAREVGCIELRTSGDVSIVRPKTLTFYSFASDEQWNYFRLETRKLPPSGVYQRLSKDAYCEEVTELPQVGYVSRAVWDADSFKGESLPDDARPLGRYFRGAFVFFQKSSMYNIGLEVKGHDVYDAMHEKMSATEFWKLIEACVRKFGRK